MAIKFVKTEDLKRCESAIAKGLQTALRSYGRVLWIVPGGSNIPVITSIMNKISLTDSAKLAIMFSDERYGPVGHPDSNLKQLYDSGFKPKRAMVIPILRPSVSLETTTSLYAEAASVAFGAANYILAFLGMGPDGHTAGILPGSPAAKASIAWVISYETPEFIRITLTPFALSHVTEVFVIARGEAKRSALQLLQAKIQPIIKQPAQLLKKLPNVVIFNDQIGDKL